MEFAEKTVEINTHDIENKEIEGRMTLSYRLDCKVKKRRLRFIGAISIPIAQLIREKIQ